jgi:hypothetical protein
MKKTFAVMLVATALYISACGSNKSPDTDTGTDSANSLPNINAPDNSSATNPSLADTAFADTLHKMKDTLKR